VKVAVVGAGVAGLGAAWLAQQSHEVVLYERDARLGGHSNTVDVPAPGGPIAVDTGFIVYNEPNYPNLAALFAHLGVATDWSDMSFAVSLDGGRYEYGSGARGFVGQRANIANPAHWRLLREIGRFNREAPHLLAAAADDLSLTLGQYLHANGFEQCFAQRYLMPMAGCIWSAPMRQMLDYPAQTFVRFFSNHGLLRIAGQLRWRTVRGGSRSYVGKLAADLRASMRPGHGVERIVRRGARVDVRDSAGQWDSFDRVILACHGDQALAMLEQPGDAERRILGAFRYAGNTAVLHGDAALMPCRRRVWSSWNYVAREGDWDAPASLTYWMNRLQNIDRAFPIFVTLNPPAAPRADRVWGRFAYAHPLFDRAALEAQRDLATIQDVDGLLFCGSYHGYGFHEDALASGLDAAEALGARRPWKVPQGRRMTGTADRTPARILPLPVAVQEPA
jgi:predicted NAD/FAD-binding protein